MHIKNRLAAALMFVLLLVMLLIPAAAGAVVTYTVDKPQGYNDSMKYPVIYVLPEKGYNMDESGLADALLKAMKEGAGAKMLIVRPVFEKGMDLYQEMADLVADVETKYSTVSDNEHRAVVGTGAGGHLAYVLALLNQDGSLRSAPDLFTCVGSADGNFAGSPWSGEFADVYSVISALEGNDFNNVLDKYFTYMDAPVESRWINDKHSTNDLGSLFINRGTASDVHEFTARLGKHDDAFMAESAKRMLDRFTKKMMTGIVSGSAKLVEETLPASASAASVNYKIDVKPELNVFTANPVRMIVNVKVVDPATGKVLSKGSSEHMVTGGNSYSGTVTVGNKVNDLVSEIQVSVNLLDDEMDVTTAYLARYKAPTSDCVELMGDWYFNYTKNTKLDCTTLSKTEFETWDTALPALTQWGDGYGNIVDPGWYGDWFPFMITGNGYYAKTFTVPGSFDVSAPVLSIGYVDDRCEVYLNGKCVGRTGIDASGNPTGDTTWAVYSCFEIDPALLNVGGENTVIVRAYNDTPYGAGGWYGGPVALYSGEAFANAGAGDTERFYEETFYSEAVGAEVPYLIYLPESYNETAHYYPTMYLLHQYNSDHLSYRVDKIDQLLDEAMEKGLIDEMIVVIPNSAETSWWAGKWVDMVAEDAVEHIEKNYRAIPDARYRMTAGCSMGGQGAYGVALQNPQVFTGAAAFFGMFDYADGFGSISPMRLAKNEGAAYMDYFTMAFICGNQDDYKFGQGKILLNQILDSQDVDHYFFIENGGHNGKFYLPYFQQTIKYVRDNMFKNTVTSAPIYDVVCCVTADESGAANSLEISVTADESIKKHFLQIPDSSYSKDYKPSITVPFIVTVDVGTGNARAGGAMTYAFNATFTEDELTWNESIDLSALGVSAKDVTQGNISLKTQFLGRDNKEGDKKLEKLDFTMPGNEAGAGEAAADLPDTGDNSSLLLALAALAVSAAALGVLIRKRSC